MIKLPNDLWIRSPKMPDYAICFDPDSPHFCWMMVENEARREWTPLAAMTPEDMQRMLAMTHLALLRFKPVVQARLAEIQAQAEADRQRGAAVTNGDIS